MDFLLAQCDHLIVTDGNIIMSVLIAGFLGSLTHCSTMCGPLVVAQIASKKAQSRAALLLEYHAGRITTYVVLGMVTALVSNILFAGSSFTHFSGTMLLIAGLMFIFSAIRPKATHSCSSCNTSRIENFLQKLSIPTPVQQYVRGVLLGFMPCGLVLSVLLLVATTHDIGIAALVMLFFGIGTMPVLQLIGYTTHKFSRRWQPAMSIFGRSAMTINGLVLCALGANAF